MIPIKNIDDLKIGDKLIFNYFSDIEDIYTIAEIDKIHNKITLMDNKFNNNEHIVDLDELQEYFYIDKPKQHVIFCLLGKSASGKTSIENELVKYGYKSVISYTTRPRRINEGNTHIFITPEEVEQHTDDMIAYTKINNAEYFATKKQLLESDLYIIDYLGIKTLRDLVKPEDNIKIVTIYIYATQDECYERVMKRKDNIEVYKNRVTSEYNQFKELEENFDFDYCIHNVDLNKSVEVIKRIMEVEK